MPAASFGLLREALVRDDLPGISITLAQKIFQASQKDGGCNVKAPATCSDVKPLIEKGYVRICPNGNLTFTRKSVAILDGRKGIPAPVATEKKACGNAGKEEKRGPMVHPRGKRVLPRNGH
jgi:hypothetical protein